VAACGRGFLAAPKPAKTPNLEAALGNILAPMGWRAGRGALLWALKLVLPAASSAHLGGIGQRRPSAAVMALRQQKCQQAQRWQSGAKFEHHNDTDVVGQQAEGGRRQAA